MGEAHMSLSRVGKLSECRQISYSNPATIIPVDNDDDEYTTPDEYFTSEENEKEEEEETQPQLLRKPRGSSKETERSNSASVKRRVIPTLTEPCRLERKSSGKDLKRQKSGGLISSAVDLFKGFRPGSDLTKLQLPPQFNLPKSQLQVYGEAVYCCAQDLLGMCADAATPVDRFLAVLRWHLSTTRPAPFAKAPYNPILGETHHVSVGDLSVLCEQVSHHPPITALHATNEVKKVEMSWWHQPMPRFYAGGSVEAAIVGHRRLRLTQHNETYESTSPNLLIRIFPVASSEWVGTTTVQCKESGFEATVTFKPKAFFGMRGSPNRVAGKVVHSSSKQVLYELSGSWDGVVTLKDKGTGHSTTLYDAQAAIADIQAPSVDNLEALSPMESVVVWSDLTHSIVTKDWEVARSAKRRVEETERARRKRSPFWTPKYFVATDDGNWAWQHQGQPVPRAPLVVNLIN